MNFANCKVKAVRADIGNGEIKLTFAIPYNDYNVAEAERLGLYVDKDDKVELRIIPNQPALKLPFGTERVEMTVVQGEEPTATKPEDWKPEQTEEKEAKDDGDPWTEERPNTEED